MTFYISDYAYAHVQKNLSIEVRWCNLQKPNWNVKCHKISGALITPETRSLLTISNFQSCKIPSRDAMLSRHALWMNTRSARLENVNISKIDVCMIFVLKFIHLSCHVKFNLFKIYTGCYIGCLILHKNNLDNIHYNSKIFRKLKSYFELKCDILRGTPCTNNIIK